MLLQRFILRQLAVVIRADMKELNPIIIINFSNFNVRKSHYCVSITPMFKLGLGFVKASKSK